MINKMKLKNWTAEKVDEFICGGDCARWLRLWQTAMLCIRCSRDVHMPRILPLRVTLCDTTHSMWLHIYVPVYIYSRGSRSLVFAMNILDKYMYLYFGRVVVGGWRMKWCYARMCAQPLPPLLCVFLSCIRCVILCFHVSTGVGACVRRAVSRLGGHSNSSALPKYAAKI